MSSNIPMTPEGHAKIKAELHHLKTVERPWVIGQIATAREHGDLRENAEYHAAREKQGFIEGRISDLESKLAHAEIIDPARLGGTRVAFGATVVLSNDAGDGVRYRIVGPVEGHPGLWVATGHTRQGVHLAAHTGEWVAEQVAS